MDGSGSVVVVIDEKTSSYHSIQLYDYKGFPNKIFEVVAIHGFANT